MRTRKPRTTALLVLTALITSLLVGAAGPAKADPAPTAWQLRSTATGACLAADYAAVYSYPGCSVSNQRWYFHSLDSGSTYQMENAATLRCLADAGSRLVKTTTCNRSDPGQQWQVYLGQSGQRWMVNGRTGLFLCTDYTTSVYQWEGVFNQSWTFS